MLPWTHIRQLHRLISRSLCCTAEKHLQGLAEWQEPQAGMFAWFKLCGGIQDADQILDKLKEEKVVVVPGTVTWCWHLLSPHGESSVLDPANAFLVTT